MSQEKTCGEKIKPLLILIETALWEHDLTSPDGPGLDDESFRAIIKIFASSVIERTWALQEQENMSDKDRINMGKAVGEEIHRLVKVYTDVDTKKLYKEFQNEQNTIH